MDAWLTLIGLVALFPVTVLIARQIERRRSR